MAGAGGVAGRGAAGARGHARTGHAARLHGRLLLLPRRREPRGRARLGHRCRSGTSSIRAPICRVRAMPIGRRARHWSRRSVAGYSAPAFGAPRYRWCCSRQALVPISLSVRPAGPRNATWRSRCRGPGVVQRGLLPVLGDDRHLHAVWRARRRLLSAPRLGAPAQSRRAAPGWSPLSSAPAYSPAGRRLCVPTDWCLPPLSSARRPRSAGGSWVPG